MSRGTKLLAEVPKLIPASGGAAIKDNGRGLYIRFVRHGHANRPFYHLVIQNDGQADEAQVIEQLGTYDPMPNKNNQKLISLNMERLRYWLGQENTFFTKPMAEILGIVGFLPIHPNTLTTAWRNRQYGVYALKKPEEKTEFTV